MLRRLMQDHPCRHDGVLQFVEELLPSNVIFSLESLGALCTFIEARVFAIVSKSLGYFGGKDLGLNIFIRSIQKEI